MEWRPLDKGASRNRYRDLFIFGDGGQVEIARKKEMNGQ